MQLCPTDVYHRYLFPKLLRTGDYGPHHDQVPTWPPVDQAKMYDYCGLDTVSLNCMATDHQQLVNLQMSCVAASRAGTTFTGVGSRHRPVLLELPTHGGGGWALVQGVVGASLFKKVETCAIARSPLPSPMAGRARTALEKAVVPYHVSWETFGGPKLVDITPEFNVFLEYELDNYCHCIERGSTPDRQEESEKITSVFITEINHNPCMWQYRNPARKRPRPGQQLLIYIELVTTELVARIEGLGVVKSLTSADMKLAIDCFLFREKPTRHLRSFCVANNLVPSGGTFYDVNIDHAIVHRLQSISKGLPLPQLCCELLSIIADPAHNTLRDVFRAFDNSYCPRVTTLFHD